MANVNDGSPSSREDNPEVLIKTYEKMIADDLKRIEEEGGADADHLKACLYEKWVPELLDTISMLCKTTSELEQVSTNAVIQLDHKLQESACATRAFMQKSAEMDSYYKGPLSYPGSSSSAMHQVFFNQNNGIDTDIEGNSLVSLQTQLTASQQSYEESKTRCQESERLVKKLQEKLAKRELQLDNLLKNQPTEVDEEKTKLKDQLTEKNTELQKAVAQKRLFEKRASDREDKIKALTMEVASKHDVVCQLEERLRQSQTRDDQHQMQLNYQGMLLEALRKEVKKYKKSPGSSSDEKTPKDSAPSSKSEQSTEKTSSAEQEVESCPKAAQGDCTKSQEYVKLERRLEELEMMLRAKNEIISTMSTDATLNRSHPLTVTIQNMGPEELKKALLNKEKEIDEQKVLISQLQDALVASKHKLEDLQKSSPEASTSSTDNKDELIHSLQVNLAEMEKQYADCFTEVCKQNHQLVLLREANQQHQKRSKMLYEELQRTNNTQPPEQEITKAGSQLADIECELAFAKAQLSIYKNKNLELEEELKKIESTKSCTEQELERILSEKSSEANKNEVLKVTLQEKLEFDAQKTIEILKLQDCINEGAMLLSDKDVQITALQEKLHELCEEAEKQMKLLAHRDVVLTNLSVTLGTMSKERDNLLNIITVLESEKKELENSEARNQSRESSSERRTRAVLQEELCDLKNQLKIAKQELIAWKQKFNVINTNLLAKEKKIEVLKSELQDEKESSAKIKNNSLKLKEAEDQVEQLRLQLSESESQVSSLKNDCLAKEHTIVALKLELAEECKRAQDEKIQYEEKVKESEEKVSEVQSEMFELKRKYDTKEQELEAIYKEKEEEMQRLIALSCENVLGLQEVNKELMTKLKNTETKVSELSLDLEDTQGIKADKLEELATARKELESICSSNTSLQNQLILAEKELSDSKSQLSTFESELILSSEKVLQLQALLAQAKEDRQRLGTDLTETRAQLSSQALTQLHKVSELSSQLQTAAVEKQHLERSQMKLEEMCKSLTVQLGGQRFERDRAVRGLRQAAAERSRLCQEAREVLSVARKWLAEHCANSREMYELRVERDHLKKENASLRNKKDTSPSVLNPWDCGLVDKEESGFWSSHWTTHFEEVDQELESLREDCKDWYEEDEEGNCRGDTGYQSGGSSK